MQRLCLFFIFLVKHLLSTRWLVKVRKGIGKKLFSGQMKLRQNEIKETGKLPFTLFIGQCHVLLQCSQPGGYS